MSELFTADRINSFSIRYRTGFILVVSFMITGCFIRMYEYWVVSSNFVLPDNALFLYASGMIYDILFLSSCGVIFFLIYLIIERFHVSAASWFVSVLMGLFLIIYVLLVLYFAEVLVPLGADFFAYNFIEVSDTVRTSVDLNISRFLPIFLFPLCFYLVFFLLKKSDWNSTVVATGCFSLVILTAGHFLFYPLDNDYEAEIDYILVANKANIFIGDTVDTFFTDSSSPYAYSGPEYPLLRDNDIEDVLGPLFDLGDRPPNLVFIILESFGGTLMPPHDSYGGFTPFLDSLASNSLYWTHFLSTSGRSFNAQPSLFGSLPYGEQGFMEMGIQSPSHHSLISILNDNGYHTAYFCGYESRFDKLDLFLERQQVDLLMDASRFTGEYEKMDEIAGGFTWGYSDKDTYRRAFDFIDTYDHQTPRLDIFFTLNFHEPFIIQESERYHEKFRQRLSELDIDSAKREEFEQYSTIFSALLYTDDAIRELIGRYRDREDYEDTIFVITGDHRMIPIPHSNRIDRYYVPFLIYSPMLKESQTFKGVSSHLDVTPSFLAFLENNYQVTVPDSVHWLGRELNMSTTFSSDRDIPFMRNKNQMLDYLSGTRFYSDNQLLQLEEGMLLRPLNDPGLLQSVNEKYDQFRVLNQYVTLHNKIIRSPNEGDYDESVASDEIYLRTQRLDVLNAEELYFRARELAFTNQYEESRIILRSVLRENPNYHDARLLLGRTYGWDGDYAQAKPYFDEVLRRNPEIEDTYVALADLSYWMQDPQETLIIVDQGLSRHPDSVELLFRKARAFRQNGNGQQARQVLDRALELAPNDERLTTFELE